MKVNNKIYYHANSGDKLKVGDILVFNSSTKNKMWDTVYNSEYLLDDMDVNEIMIKHMNNKDINFTNDELVTIFKTVNNDVYVMRELALEEVRKEKYSNYPSRLRCMYVCPNIDDAREWVNILKRNNKECHQILKLECSGEVFSFDGKLLRRINCSYNKHLENAEKYWSKSTNENNEYLFYGTAIVVDIEEV